MTSTIPVDFDALKKAGRDALASGDMRAAANLLEVAAALSRGQRQEHVPLVLDLARSLRGVGELRRAERILNEVADGSGDAPSRYAFLESASLSDYTEATSDSFGRLDKARRARRTTSDGEARRLILEAEVSWTNGKYGDMEGQLGQADQAVDGSGTLEPRALRNSIDGWQARACLLGPKPAKDAVVLCGKLLSKARARRAGGVEASVLAVRAGLRAMLANFDGARSDYQTSRRTGEALGRTAWLAALPLYSGPVELLDQRAVHAERELRRGYDALVQMGDRSRAATTAAFLAHALYGQQRDDEAEKFARKAERLAAENDVFTQVVWRGALAKVLARRGDCEAAVRHAREGVSKAPAETHAPNLLGDALLDQAVVLHACGRKTARERAEKARHLYDRKGNVAAVRRADAFIARLP